MLDLRAMLAHGTKRLLLYVSPNLESNRTLWYFSSDRICEKL